MGRVFEAQVPQLNASKRLIGCMAHVINLVAKSGIEFFYSKKASQVQLSLPPSPALIVDQQPTSNLTSICTCVRGFLKRVNNSNKLTATVHPIIDNESMITQKARLVQEVSAQLFLTHNAIQ